MTGLPAAPRSRLTAQVRRDVLVDRAMHRFVTTTAARGAPAASELARIGQEIDLALALFGERGWLDEPTTYHQDPPSPTGVRMRVGSRRSPASTITWDDGFVCHPDEPGGIRFAGYRQNRIARATILQHRSSDRPWLVCLHGFGMGTPRIDLRGFRAAHLYRDLGLNLAFLTLPFHGARRTQRSAMPQFPGIDMLDNVHGLAQAVWDARQLLAWVRARTEQPVGVVGLSLGGLVAALTASLDDVHAALLLVPVADLGTLVADTSELQGLGTPEQVELVGKAQQLLRPVSPLALTPRVPVERRFLVAGTLDRFVRPSSQAIALWHHWDEPEVHWYHGGHVSLFWDRRARTAIDTTLRTVFSEAG